MLLGCVTASSLHAATILYANIPGSDLNLATGDGNPGVTTLTATINDPFVILPTGNNVTVFLTGLQYPFAGDLQATLTLLVGGNPVASADIFNRIGKASGDPNDFGYATQFGYSITINSGDFAFNSGFTGPFADLWNTAAGLGSSDSIPSGNYWTTTAFSSNPDTLSSDFNGLPVAGTWQLQILDYEVPPDSPSPPGLLAWSLQFNTVDATVPEPATSATFALGLAALIFAIRRNRARSSPASRPPTQ